MDKTQGAHENFDRARNELQNIAFEAKWRRTGIVNYGDGVKQNLTIQPISFLG